MIELEVAGMTCQHCVRAVRDALGAVPGVTRVVDVDLGAGRARVEGDPDPRALTEAIKEAGYVSSLASSA